MKNNFNNNLAGSYNFNNNPFQFLNNNIISNQNYSSQGNIIDYISRYISNTILQGIINNNNINTNQNIPNNMAFNFNSQEIDKKIKIKRIFLKLKNCLKKIFKKHQKKKIQYLIKKKQLDMKIL